MIMTKELKYELYDQERLNLIKRTHRNVFFPHLPVQDDYQDCQVNFLDPFQSFDDFHNELRAMLVKPLMCEYLSAKHQLTLSLELSMLLINCVTLSPSKAAHSGLNVVHEFISSVFYAVNGVIAETTAVASFALRCLMTIADFLYRLVNPAEQVPVAIAVFA